MKTEPEINMGLSYPINFAGSNTVRKKTTAPQQCKTSLDWNLSYLRLVAPPPLADFVSGQRGGSCPTSECFLKYTLSEQFENYMHRV